MDKGIIVQQNKDSDDIEDEERENIEKSIENNIDSMLDSFGMFE